MYRHLLLALFLFAFLGARAQIADTTIHRSKNDSLNMKRDSLTSKPFAPKVKKPKVYHPDSTHSPHKAVMRSLYFAGLGQIYNRHGLYWRLPLLYGGLAALAYNIYTNGKDYNSFLKEAEWREQGRPYPKNPDGTQQKNPDGTLKTGEPLPNYQNQAIINVADQTIIDFKDNLRRNRDLSIFGFVGVWGINMVDAYVEATFMHSYTMDNNLSFKITPLLMGTPAIGPVYASNFSSTFTPSLKITFFLK